MSHTVLGRHSQGPVSQVTRYVDACYSLNTEEVAAEYQQLLVDAPTRRTAYVRDRDISQRAAVSNRREELLAHAIFEARTVLRFPGWGPFTIVDFQTPLKSKRSDRFGKVDLLGAGEGLCVVELKVHNTGGGSDNPLNALLEAVEYCAVVARNAEVIADEVLAVRGVAVGNGGMSALVVATQDYWDRWDRTRTPQDWRAALRVAREIVSTATGVRIGFGSFSAGDVGPETALRDVLR